MSYPARVFRIAIASPSDVEEERATVVKAIQEWNDLHSADRKAVLLPLRWETHTAPTLGERPQETINREVIDHADLLIGIFWTRLGSPTGEHTSGTLEEIDHAGRAGKPVMLYFSRARVDPTSIDLDQLRALREYQSATYPQGLVENYATIVEFRDKLSRQLEMHVRKLMLAAAEGQVIDEEVDERRPLVHVEFADALVDDLLGEELSVALDRVEYEVKAIPDFQEEKKKPNSLTITVFSSSSANPNFYREYARYQAFLRSFHPLRLGAQNLGNVGVRDVLLEVSLLDGPRGTKILGSDEIPGQPSKTMNSMSTIFQFSRSSARRRTEDYHSELDVGALQPGRTVIADRTLYVTAAESGVMRLAVLIYGDRLPAPVKQVLTISVDVTTVPLKPEDLVPELATDLK
ncbi:hypothetical protein [Longimicrobium terrae]|uniref:DUF4062 domain-containing protein n=1 Tax=Longimicrobium terrae TaxID=1639882 RepID=A0A841H340_9BACT|nr:hypothetical protein [Longimicrobium terrae]MBB4638139.1 hypothetical protein [Longimicrobium terrae]MBB6072511.1 hypothetical protein [Longimicrobium terrae]NNC32079.1 hypothetical protein [Longimicrobium terrae]